MNEFILSEVNFFLASFLWGAVMFLVYDLLVILRKVIPHAKFMVAIEDIGFWVTAGILIFRMMYHLNDGVIRYYAVISTILGMKIYQWTLGKLVLKVGTKVGLFIRKQVIRFFKLIARPIRFLGKQIRRFLRFIGRIIKKRFSVLYEFLRKQLKKVRKKVTIKRKKRPKDKVMEVVEPVKVRGVLELVQKPLGEGELNEKIQKEKA